MLTAINHKLQNENQILKEKLASNEVQHALIPPVNCVVDSRCSTFGALISLLLGKGR